jgi:hypothetical protein
VIRARCPKCGERIDPTAKVEFRADGLVQHAVCGPDYVPNHPRASASGFPRWSLVELLVLVALLACAWQIAEAIR